jgi:xeroderma pigmentosum group C-complementing protein
VDLWNESHLPEGTVHLPYPRIAAVARKMNIDYADAMTGFEIKQRRSVPVFNGIVICKEFAEGVLERYWERESELQEAAVRKRSEKLEFYWRRLIRATLVRHKIMQDLKEKHAIEAPSSVESSSSPSLTNSIRVENTIDHIHEFAAESKSFDPNTGAWTRTCKCGMRVNYEEM